MNVVFASLISSRVGLAVLSGTTSAYPGALIGVAATRVLTRHIPMHTDQAIA